MCVCMCGWCVCTYVSCVYVCECVFRQHPRATGLMCEGVCVGVCMFRVCVCVCMFVCVCMYVCIRMYVFYTHITSCINPPILYSRSKHFVKLRPDFFYIARRLTPHKLDIFMLSISIYKYKSTASSTRCTRAPNFSKHRTTCIFKTKTQQNKQINQIHTIWKTFLIQPTPYHLRNIYTESLLYSGTETEAETQTQAQRRGER
jgi:hypothetical protein